MAVTWSYIISAGDPMSPLLVHVPHAATDIPYWVREDIVLSDDELADELAHMTDAHIHRIAAAAAERVPLPPWMFVNLLSRLVVDPERFPDGREQMHAVGMGAVYTRTSAGKPLRRAGPQGEAALLNQYFYPYARAFADLVDERLALVGRAIVIDVHSYPQAALPYELHRHTKRPAVCLGVDTIHTPGALVDLATKAFAPVGDVSIDEPFAGTYVPKRHYGVDRRVESLMIEIRRDTYMTEPGGPPNRGVDLVTDSLATLLAGLPHR